VTRSRVLGLVVALVSAATLSCALQGDYPAPALGVLVDRNLTVVAVLQDSAGEKTGVQVGDVLMTLNGSAFVSAEDWRNAVSLIETGRDYDLTVQRAGQTRTLRVTSLPHPPNNLPPGVTPTVVPTDIYSVRLLVEP
jgi:S1-C subfamily serine protease